MFMYYTDRHNVRRSVPCTLPHRYRAKLLSHIKCHTAHTRAYGVVFMHNLRQPCNYTAETGTLQHTCVVHNVRDTHNPHSMSMLMDPAYRAQRLAETYLAQNNRWDGHSQVTRTFDRVDVAEKQEAQRQGWGREG
ncbi:hypothetical protein SARC_11398 [Sphaeroforma arctica JP610]|uniref:Uncharacterized protein n=1 Tax=Sphaeroforma arctica JP610 TaxID=667725 RepID=A0A0L0FJB0_9EUKA|nr:hypothetical protein SARC_11398 [Sphaeroforma arctica JP610]KNC76088.1 hypothetical protein SARC_11398 [Sphaeroforma arctica JP610]|eukprot:XP_014149990.1 hypothetical protein SARC_11398 [Sphaeroforma arctica JP610]